MHEAKKIKQNKIINILLSFIIAILVLFLGLKINFTKVIVNGSSMHPTLIGNYEDGYEYGYTDRFIFKITGLDRFDIVVIKKSNDELWIKRLIGMPNEKIQIKEGLVYINDEVLENDIYCDETILDPGLASEPIFLGDDEYFVMGDNRNHSTDSRNSKLGIVKYKDIYGHSFISRGTCKSITCEFIESKHDYEVKGW